jgi:hypothetical protein
VSRQRLDVRQAAEALGISSEGVRKRIKRGTLESEKSPDGKVFIWLDGPDQDRTEYGRGADTRPDALLDSLQDQVSYLRDQLAREREANRENRRLLAAALERMPPQLEAPREEPSEPRDTPKMVPEDASKYEGPPEQQEPTQRRSWLYRFFFGP